MNQIRPLEKKYIQAYLGDIAGLVLDHENKANIAIKRVTQIFWFLMHTKVIQDGEKVGL